MYDIAGGGCLLRFSEEIAIRFGGIMPVALEAFSLIDVALIRTL